MASNSHCVACLRLLALQFKRARKVRGSHRFIFLRPLNKLQPPTSIFRSSPSRRISSFPPLLSTGAASNNTASRPSPLPKSNSPAQAADLEPDIPSPSSTGPSLAARVRKIASGTTETYIAYGACDVLVKECSRQADYTIPQALEKKGVIPKTKDGEDLGIGSGQWYEGNDYYSFWS